MTPLLLSAAMLVGAAPPTFTADIAPLVFAHCSGCHRPGEVGPFPLLTYADVKQRGRQIADVTGRKLMPPWKPVAPHGTFEGDRSLTAAQVALFEAWHAAGCPEGDPAALPPTPAFPQGWHLGPPDLVLEVKEPFRVPAEGEDPYVYFVLPTGLTRDRYVRAVQVVPSNKRVAHHGVPILDKKGGDATRLAKARGGDWYQQFGGPGFLPRGFLPGYAPGATVREGRADQRITLPKGVDVVLNMHYHPTGKVEFDKPKVGLYFTDEKPDRDPSIFLLGTSDIDIPAGDATYTRADTYALNVDYEMRSVYAHMHMVGKRVEAWATLPDGTRRDLLTIADWDFNWQDTYNYAAPFVLPAGTVVTARFTWDNSGDHPRNPNTPPARVTLGEGSTDEMAGVIFGGVPVRKRDEARHWGAALGHWVGLEIEKRRVEDRLKRR